MQQLGIALFALGLVAVFFGAFAVLMSWPFSKLETSKHLANELLQWGTALFVAGGVSGFLGYLIGQ